MITVAEALQEARLATGKTIQQVSEEIKIRSSYLNALEENAYDKFLSETQLKGFLTNYANHIGIDTNKILALYRRERISAKDESHSPKYIKEKKVFIFTPKMLIGPILGILVLCVIGFFVFQYYQTARSPLLEIQEPKDGVTTQNVKLIVSGIAEVGSTIRVNSKDVPSIDNNGRFQTTVELSQPGNNLIFIDVLNGFNKKTTKTINVIYAPITITPTPNISSNIILNVKSIGKNLDLNITQDDGNLSTSQIKPGESKIITGNNKVVLDGIFGRNLNISLNGVSLNLDPSKKTFIFIWDDSTKTVKMS